MTSELPRVAADSSFWKRMLERIATDLPRELVDAAVRSARWPSSIPAGHYDTEVLPIVMSGTLTVLAAIEDGRRITATEATEWVLPIIERHAEDGIPLPTLVSALAAAWAHLWGVIHEIAEDGDGPVVAALGANLSEVMGTINLVMTETYQDTDSVLRATKREGQRKLISALLAGDPTTELAIASGISVAESYYVLAVRVDDPTLPHELIARRRARYAQHVLDEFGSTDVLNTFDGCQGTVLLPEQIVDAGDAGGDRTTESLVDALSDRLAVDIYAGVRLATVSDLPAAAAEAHELAHLARQLNRRPGLYRLNDLIFEYQATRPGPGRSFLTELIAPVQQHPGLLQALQMHLKYGADRKAAAAELFVHPNTFTYRLKRITELTGVDPTDPNGSRLFAAALTTYLVDETAEPDTVK